MYERRPNDAGPLVCRPGRIIARKFEVREQLDDTATDGEFLQQRAAWGLERPHTINPNEPSRQPALGPIAQQLDRTHVTEAPESSIQPALWHHSLVLPTAYSADTAHHEW